MKRIFSSGLAVIMAVAMCLSAVPFMAFAEGTPSDLAIEQYGSLLPENFGLSTTWQIVGSETSSNIFDINNSYNWVYLANNNTIYGVGNSSHEGTHELATNAKKIFSVSYSFMVYLDMDNTLHVSDYKESKAIMTNVIDAKVGYNGEMGYNDNCLLVLCYDGSVYVYNVGRATNPYSKDEYAGPWLLANDGARLITISTGSSITGEMPVYISNDGHLFSTIKDNFNDKFVKAAIKQEWKITAIRYNLDYDRRASGNSAIWQETVLLAYNDEKQTWCIIDYLDTVDGSVEESKIILGTDYSAINEHSIANDSVNVIVNDFIKWKHFVIGFSSGTYGSIKELSGELTADDTLYFGGTKVAENVKCYNSFYSQLWFLTKNGDFFMSKLNANSDFELTQTNVNFAYLWNMGAIYFVTNDGRLTDNKGNVIATNVKLIDKIYDTVITPVPTPTPTPTPTGPFTDIAGHWAYDAIVFCNDNGIMTGSGGKFTPDGTLNRAMMATLLYNLEGKPGVTYSEIFSDVPSGEWYSEAVIWAAESEIVGGVGGGAFNPNGNITREQMMTMLYNYAKNEGYDTSAAADLSGFSDSGNVSSWARDGISWCVAKGIVSGSGGKLNPNSTASRAECAKIMQGFVEKAG